jgi:ubiquinone/menaquinone biosynthesis C-methylase UbiE
MKLNNKYIYQENFSKLDKAVFDSKKRITKSKKIFSIINDYLRNDKNNLNKMICLDIGGSAGFTAKLMSPHINKYYVIDIDKKALNYGRRNNNATNIIYKYGDAMNLPFRNQSVDIAICNQVYEHVPSHTLLVSEIYRVFLFLKRENKYKIKS